MPIARFQMPDGRVARFQVPDGTTPEEAQSLMAAQMGGQTADPAQSAPPPRSMMDSIKQGAGNLLAGGIRGAGSIGATVVAPYDMAKDAMAGKGLSLESNRARRTAMDQGLEYMGAQPDSMMYQGGKLAGEIAGTAGAGGVLANGAARAGMAPAMVNAFATSGMRAGAPGTNAMANMAMRTTGGASAGATAAGMVNPEDAGLGAMIGGAFPGVAMAAGRAGQAVGRVMSGASPTPEVAAQIAAARQAGYVMPPSQARPSLGNRALEGFAGKLTTAQNASAANQPITNKLAARALNAPDLTPAALDAVRTRASSAYEQIKGVGAFAADDTFRNALKTAGGMSERMRQNFPGLANNEIDDLVASLSSRPGFDSESTIEAIKQFRFQGAANKGSMEPAKKALGSAQMKISAALEDMIDRNLQQAGQPDMLKNFRDARTTFAKLYDVEKALNATSRNVDPTKIAKMADKGRPLTGELKQIADFTRTFPKASRAVEGMGSLPGISPLDFGALGTVSAATANPMLMAGIVARPAARAMALSKMVQNRLLPGQPGYLEQLLSNQQAQQLMYRTAPVVGD